VSRPTALFLALVGVLAAVACDKIPLTAPLDSTINLAVSTTTLGLNGTAEVVASVTEPAGTPVHDGTTVVFTASVGIVEPREARTEGGVARATFRSGGQSGTATITAFSGSARSEPVEVLVGGAAAETVMVRAEPPTVRTSGGSVQVIAYVVDASGNPLAGVPVGFSSDFGTFSANSVATGANGEARVTLNTNRDTVVTASVGGKTGTATIRAVTTPVVTIEATTTDPIVGVPVAFRLTADSSANAPRVTNVTVDFGDGTPPVSLGAMPTPPATKATTHVYTRADSYTVTATAADQDGQTGSSSIIVTVRRASPTIFLTVSPAAPTVGQAVTVTVNITNPNNIRVQSLTVFFGNGTQAFLGAPQSGTVTAATVYNAAGTYTVRAELVDVNGEVVDVRTQIVVR
jgi:Bacterial Ig-like domain (group 1)/PKD domain